MPFQRDMGDSAPEINTRKPSPEDLRKLLRYVPETGRLYWRERGLEWFSPVKGPEKRMAAWNSRYAGQEALTATNASGHRIGSVLQRGMSAHRVAWAIHYGVWPENVIDHINGDPSDNRIENLRDVTQQQNCRNAALKSNNKSGISGVWDQNPKSWGARWKVVIGEAGGIIYTKTHRCLGCAIKDRNQQYRLRGYTADHGLRVAANG